MKHINVGELSNEIGLNVETVMDETLAVIAEESTKADFKYYLVDNTEKIITIADKEDIMYLQNGRNNDFSFPQISKHFKIDIKRLNWVLAELFNQKAINDSTYEYYTNVRDAPIIEFSYDPSDVYVGQDIYLTVTLSTNKSIDNFNAHLNLPSGVEQGTELSFPLEIRPGERESRIQLQSLIYGSHQLTLSLEGLIEDQKWAQTITVPDLVIKPKSPKLKIGLSIPVQAIKAGYNQVKTIEFKVINSGEGEAFNVKLSGLDKYPDFRVVSGQNLGNVSVKGENRHTLSIIPTQTGEYTFDGLELNYEDGSGTGQVEPVSPFKISVQISKPKLNLSVDDIRTVSPEEIFSITLQSNNIGEGPANGITFKVDIEPSNAKVEGPRRVNYPNLASREIITEIIKLKAPSEGTVFVNISEITYRDEADSLYEIDDKTYRYPVREIMIGRLEWPFQVDEVIHNQFKILGEIGVGGFSKVYHIYDTTLTTEWALKALQDTYVQDEEKRREFIGEAMKMVPLQSDYIVKVRHLSELKHNGESYPYIIMEYLPDDTLDKVLSKRTMMPPEEACRVSRSVCRALRAIYEHPDPEVNGIIHGDIKPSNLFLNKETQYWKLGDFGIAKIIRGADLQPSGRSIDYSAPELFDNPPRITKKSDIYSLGRVLIEALTGDPQGNLSYVRQMKGYPQQFLDRICDVIERMVDNVEDNRPDYYEVLDKVWPKETLGG